MARATVVMMNDGLAGSETEDRHDRHQEIDPTETTGTEALVAVHRLVEHRTETRISPATRERLLRDGEMIGRLGTIDHLEMTDHLGMTAATTGVRGVETTDATIVIGARAVAAVHRCVTSRETGTGIETRIGDDALLPYTIYHMKHNTRSVA